MSTKLNHAVAPFAVFAALALPAVSQADQGGEHEFASWTPVAEYYSAEPATCGEAIQAAEFNRLAEATDGNVAPEAQPAGECRRELIAAVDD